MLLFARIFDRKTGLVTYRKNGNEILVDHHGGDENGTRHCIVGTMYSDYLSDFRLPNDVRVLDLGANGGGFPLMLKLAGINLTRVVSVEFNPLTFCRLQLNLATNLGSCAIAINAAATGRSENSEIHIVPSRGSTSQSIYASRTEPNRASVAVKTTTLQQLYDQYFTDHRIDICKIDIESAEYEFLEAAGDDLLRKIRYLIIELHDPARNPALLERLSSLGFTEIVAKNPDPGDGDVHAFRGPADPVAA